MAVTINASIDGTTYSNITKIVTGGKDINLSGVVDGSDLPSNVAQIVTGSYTQDSDSGATKTFTHGCSGTPDIIIMWSDFQTRYTSESKPQGTTIIAECWNGPGKFKAYGTVSTSYTGEGSNVDTPAAATLASTNDGHITNVGDSTFDVLFKSNRRCGGGLTYRWLAIRLV